jgi:hypothetical protein
MKKVIKRGDLRVRAEVGSEFDLDGEGDRTRIAKLKITILGLPEQPDKWSITCGHHLDYLIDELPVWTERFDPGDIDELWEALAELNLGFEYKRQTALRYSAPANT